MRTGTHLRVCAYAAGYKDAMNWIYTYITYFQILCTFLQGSNYVNVIIVPTYLLPSSYLTCWASLGMFRQGSSSRLSLLLQTHLKKDDQNDGGAIKPEKETGKSRRDNEKKEVEKDGENEKVKEEVCIL